MPAAEPVVDAPRVTAILVACNGAAWLPQVLASVAQYRYPGAVEVVAVDNGSSDGSAAILEEHLGPERVIRLPRNAGFGRAVAAALAQFEPAQEADFLLLLHDDLVLAPTALRRMARALVEDPSLSIVGPKLRFWTRERMLQQVGMTVDRLGRAESRVEPDELDQGQHDTQRETLYVSTAGMLLRREVFVQVGGFDARYPAFRDDLDLCWRAWLAGLRVEVVPRAVGYHRGAATSGARSVGTGRRWESRFLAERHSISTLLKNYGLLRLVWILPAALALGGVKTLGFLASRRFGAALAVVLAWIWNLFQLPKTLRRRRRVQQTRVAADGELLRLFAPGLPRLREYKEALAGWLAGGSTRALIEERDQPMDAIEGGGVRALARWWRGHAAATVGSVLLIAYLLGLVGLLGRGPLVGGEIRPWPEAATDFWLAYASPWGGEPFGSAAFASPIQAVLGLVSLLGFGSAWAAQRVAVLGLVPLAWGLAVRAGRLVSPRVGPRVLGATLYVLSPPVLGALATGRFGALVVAALLPGLVLVGVRAADAAAPAAGGWRAAALLALGLAVAGAADVALLPLVGLLWAIGLVASALARRPGRTTGSLRLLGAGAVAAGLLVPWLLEHARAGWPTLTAAAAGVELPLWRALAVAPDVLPGMVGAGGWVAGASAAGVALAALLLGVRRQPLAVAGLLLGWAAASVVAWGIVALPQLAAVPALAVWPFAPLFVAALAMAALGVLAAHRVSGALGGHAFGARHLATGAIALVILVGIGTGVWRVASDPWTGLARAPELLPAFVVAEEERVGPYRVAIVDASADAEIRWDLTDAHGPTMLTYGEVPAGRLLEHLDASMGDLTGGADPRAGQGLGLANVRYVVVNGTAVPEEVLAALNRQPAIEPVPGGGNRIWRVESWVPRAVVLPAERAEAVLAGEDPGDLAPFEEGGLRAVDRGRYAGANPQPDDGGILLLAEARDAAWQAIAGGSALERADLTHPAVNAFEVPADATRLTVDVRGSGLHLGVMGGQLLVVLGLLSVAVRPPRAPRRRRPPTHAALPDALEGPGDDTDPDLGVPVTSGGAPPEQTDG